MHVLRVNPPFSMSFTESNPGFQLGGLGGFKAIDSKTRFFESMELVLGRIDPDMPLWIDSKLSQCGGSKMLESKFLSLHGFGGNGVEVKGPSIDSKQRRPDGFELDGGEALLLLIDTEVVLC